MPNPCLQPAPPAPCPLFAWPLGGCAQCPVQRRPLTSSSHLQGAAELGLEKIPEPIKEATALFYGEEGPRQ